MLLRQLEYFVAVARERHFARAAEAATCRSRRSPRRSPSWNASSNVTLINRGQNFEGLTLEGERLVVWAKRVLAEHDGLKAEAAAMRSGISGTLRLGTGPTVSTTTALPVAAFCALHPLAKVKVCSRLSSTELLRQLRNFELDAAIAHFGPDDQSGLEVVPLYEEQYVLLVSGDQLVPGARTITWAEAAQLPLALLTPHMRFRQFIDKAFASQRGGRVTPGGNRFRRFALRARGHRRMGERGATHLAARDAGDGSGASHPPRRAGHHGADLDGDPRGTPGSVAARAFLNVAGGHAAGRRLRPRAARPRPRDVMQALNARVATRDPLWHPRDNRRLSAG